MTHLLRALMTVCVLAFTVGMLGTLTACNTAEGLGQDVEAAGDMIEETAEETEDELDD